MVHIIASFLLNNNGKNNTAHSHNTKASSRQAAKERRQTDSASQEYRNNHQVGSAWVVLAPITMQMDRSIEPVLEAKVAGRVHSKDLIPICACGNPINQCNTGDICSYYGVWPDCIGCYTQQTCCCISLEQIACKPSNIEGEYCVIDNTRCTLIYAETLISSFSQCCCIDRRCAMPPTKDIPRKFIRTFFAMFHFLASLWVRF